MPVHPLDLIYSHPELADLDASARRVAVEALVREELGDREAVSETTERVVRWIDGLGPLTDLLFDDGISDVLINGDELWIERDGTLQRAELPCDRAELDALVERFVGDGGASFDALHPVCDVMLPNGDRMHLVGPPVVEQAVVSIRRFPRRPLSLEDLVERGAVSTEDAVTLQELVTTRSSIVVSGATGVGKTTLLGALLSFVPGTERVVTIEENRELRCEAEHVIHLVGREANVEGAGAITMSRLVRAALRMRPDRIVVGEVRGEEAADALWAMSTGHKGSMLTVHARGAAQAPDVLAALAARGSPATAPDLARRFRDCIDAFVHLERVGDRRIVTQLRVS